MSADSGSEEFVVDRRVMEHREDHSRIEITVHDEFVFSVFVPEVTVGVICDIRFGFESEMNVGAHRRHKRQTGNCREDVFDVENFEILADVDVAIVDRPVSLRSVAPQFACRAHHRFDDAGVRFLDLANWLFRRTGPPLLSATIKHLHPAFFLLIGIVPRFGHMSKRVEIEIAIEEAVRPRSAKSV